MCSVLLLSPRKGTLEGSSIHQFAPTEQVRKVLCALLRLLGFFFFFFLALRLLKLFVEQLGRFLRTELEMMEVLT